MTFPQNSSEKFVKITLTSARYILDTTRDLISWLHGGQYDPERGIIIPSEDGEPIPSLYQAQDQTDQALQDWLSRASMILKLVAGIVSFELARVGDNEDPSSIEILSGSTDPQPRIWSNSLFADPEEYTFDSSEHNVVYGAQSRDYEEWDDEENGTDGEI